ncbi:lipase member H-A-like [Toxorhynchites rutilus septentrionalis]|uniref:lipase member H-A-like n=1 Tax=Toxorhynchites rutilus septentrionalis TaxID=329112 RepID=UPI002478D786|nr:lipase member H-A-like [Toxorhynchites rutilus septentrionalis]
MRIFVVLLGLLFYAAAADWHFFNCVNTERRCPNENVTFWLYTRETQKNPTQLNMFEPNTIKGAPFAFGRPLIVLIHGYTGHRDYAPNPTIRPAYLAYDEFNVISLDYNPLAQEPCYHHAVRNLPTVANCTAHLLDYMISQEMFTLSDIHVVGFSLGAQTSGMISNYLRSGKLKRITGLDPAKPLFMTAPKAYKLDHSDAEFVQVIHTDVFARGILHPCGHTDFYVNGGADQPGCSTQTVVSPGECNHNRAPEYYAESIASEVGFYGYRCAHWYLYMLGFCTDQHVTALMGAHTPNTTRGLYFTDANSIAPYAQGRKARASEQFPFPL